MFVLKRNDGKYVTPPGQPHSYTDRLQHARGFRTKEAAEQERCPDNETVVPLENEIQVV